MGRIFFFWGGGRGWPIGLDLRSIIHPFKILDLPPMQQELFTQWQVHIPRQ